MMVSTEAARAAVKAAKESFGGDVPRGMRAAIRAALEAAAPHMQPDLLEEWAVQFASGSVEEAESKADAHRKLHEIREAIVDGIETPSLEPMQVVRRYRVASSELTKWKVVTP